jgi:uncharacterized protein (DUF2235 family)
MGKHLIICLDGTWRAASNRSAPLTNIGFIADVIAFEPANGSEQVIYYDAGARRRGALGLGASAGVLAAYRFLSHYYALGDSVYIFGFSRGAFSARSLCGLLSASGLLFKDRCSKENEAMAWGYYRTPPKDRYPADHARLHEITHDFCSPDPLVRFLGVFDTVGLLGVPKGAMRWSERQSLQFHDTKVSKAVKHACHAIAIDEARADYEPTLWVAPKANRTGTVEQVWFPGSHADVGGRGKELILADLSLGWMLTRLRFYCPELELRPFKDWRRERFNDYPDCMGFITSSASLPRIVRWPRSRRVINGNGWASSRIWARGEAASHRQIPTIGEMVHESARERYYRTRGAVQSKDRYEPPNLLAALTSRNTPVVGLDGEQLPELVGRNATGIVRLQLPTVNAETKGKDCATDTAEAKRDAQDGLLARGSWVQGQMRPQGAADEMHVSTKEAGGK